MMIRRNTIFALVAAQALLLAPRDVRAGDGEDPVMVGIMVSVGGRYDDVRMCVGSPAGVKGGPAMDISFFTEVGLGEGRSITVNIPVMRPILFGAAFKMLQFEPDVTLNFLKVDGRKVDFWVGPTFGVTFHYGPDYTSERSGPGRGDSFFAMGPKFGGSFGVAFDRPGETFDFVLAVAPYVTTLFSINDARDHRGVVIGGSLTGQFRFETGGDQ